MKRRTGLGVSLLFVGLYLARIALAGFGGGSPAAGVLAATAACFGAGLISGVLAPDAIPDEDLGPRATRAFVALLLVGGVGLLSLSLLPLV